MVAASCPKCGRAYPTLDPTCPYCGLKARPLIALTEPQPTYKPPGSVYRQGRAGRVVAWIVAGAVVVLALTYLLMTRL